MFRCYSNLKAEFSSVTHAVTVDIILSNLTGLKITSTYTLMSDMVSFINKVF